MGDDTGATHGKHGAGNSVHCSLLGCWFLAGCWEVQQQWLSGCCPACHPPHPTGSPFHQQCCSGSAQLLLSGCSFGQLPVCQPVPTSFCHARWMCLQLPRSRQAAQPATLCKGDVTLARTVAVSGWLWLLQFCDYCSYEAVCTQMNWNTKMPFNTPQLLPRGKLPIR